MKLGIVARRSVMLGIGALPLAGRSTYAQSAWPNQSIRLVVPFAPGGTTDLVARLIGAGLQEKLGVSVVVENRAGAGATIGSETVARATPDGYTLVMSNIASHAISPAVYGQKVRYDPVKDFAHIALVVSNPTVWVANPRAGIRNLADVAARAKAPGGLQVATSGAGSSNHLLVVQMGRLIGTEITHVPFRGSAPMLTEMVAERIELGMDNIPSALTFVREGKIRAIGVTGAERSAVLPDVPTIAEQGMPGFEATAWFGVLAPSATPAPVIARLGAELDAIGKDADFRARIAAFGADPPRLTPDGGSSPESFAAFMRAEVTRWAEVVRQADIRVE
jgi:tripartite-type tricarboxylate transporter receptor subunit TctC